MKGSTHGGPPRVSNSEILWSWIGASVGMTTITWVNRFLFEEHDMSLIIGSFGASAVLIYGAVKSPLAQPRNLIGGHLISALIGVLSYKLLGPHLWLASSIAVATSLALMHISKTLHPPGGATALIAVIGGP